MSVAEVQQRIAEIQSLFTRGVAGASGTAPVAFASVLSDALGGAGDVQGASGADQSQAVSGASGGGVNGDDIVAAAKQFLGVPYVWGGESPSGFDCSGLVQYVFKQRGIDLPRVAEDQARVGTPVSVNDLRPGDLVFFGSPVNHVGIYAGGGKMVVAPHTGDVVKIQDVNMGAITAARRIVAPGGSGGSVSAQAAPSGGDGAWVARLPAAGRRWAAPIADAAAKAGIDPRLVAAVAWAESDFDPGSGSSAGAIGLMQLMPSTARGLGVNPYDSVQNLIGGARELAAQVRRFGTLDLALAAYNAGPGAVTRYGGVPPYGETQAYVRRVLSQLNYLKSGGR